MIDGDLAFDDHMVLLERSDALPKLVLLDYATAKETLIEQSETAYSVRPEENHEFKAKTFRYTYQTLRTPATVVEYDLPTKARTLLKETKT